MKNTEASVAMPKAPPAPKCSHRGEPIQVGPYTVYAGGSRYLTGSDLKGFDLILPLDRQVPLELGQVVTITGVPWFDMDAPPKGFLEFLEETVMPVIESGKKVLFYCTGGHGRTGTFLATLIALLEPETEDPIAAARTRHCENAVETRSQGDFIFNLRGQTLPLVYDEEFYLKELEMEELMNKWKSSKGSEVKTNCGMYQ